MKIKFGISLIVAGCLLVAGGLGFLICNHQEQRNAGEAVNSVMPQMVDAIKDRQQAQKDAASALPLENSPADDADRHNALALPGSEEAEIPLPTAPEMPVVEIDGHGYIGFVGIPSLGKELPVMADWSYPKLKISPCRFTGSIYTDDLVIMAHNYSHHFGTLQNLRTGDIITFTDMDGNTIRYEVVALDIL